MKLLNRVAITLFIVALPTFLLSSNVRWVINAPALYSYGFDKYDIPSYTGIERAELLIAAGQIREYFNNDEEFVVIRVFMRGILIENLFNTREILHMKDVKELIKIVYLVQIITCIYLFWFMSVGLVIWRREFLYYLIMATGLAAGLTVGLVILIGLMLFVGFDQLFLAFHLISFTNDLWQLDPRTDYLIAMFPEGFFFDASMWIAGSTTFESVLLVLMSVVLLRWRPARIFGRRQAEVCAQK